MRLEEKFYEHFTPSPGSKVKIAKIYVIFKNANLISSFGPIENLERIQQWFAQHISTEKFVFRTNQELGIEQNQLTYYLMNYKLLNETMSQNGSLISRQDRVSQQLATFEINFQTLEEKFDYLKQQNQMILNNQEVIFGEIQKFQQQINENHIEINEKLLAFQKANYDDFSQVLNSLTLLTEKQSSLLPNTNLAEKQSSLPASTLSHPPPKQNNMLYPPSLAFKQNNLTYSPQKTVLSLKSGF